MFSQSTTAYFKIFAVAFHFTARTDSCLGINLQALFQSGDGFRKITGTGKRYTQISQSKCCLRMRSKGLAMQGY